VNRSLTFIIPAAGKSSRFKTNVSKIFFKYQNKLIIQHIIDKCLFFSNNIIIISNKKNLKRLKNFLKIYDKFYNIKILVQKKPLGMGDAVNIGLQKVKTKNTATIWADQIYLKKETITKTLNYFDKSKSLFTFPVFLKKNPYTIVVRDKSKNFVEIIQSKEINYKIKVGESDCGFFIFKTSPIRKLIKKLINKKTIMTKKSNEIDFLSSFKFIKKLGKVTTIKAKNERDTIGINYKKDLV
jgi:bifunctional N-acetylglucosamine-1-phosphate-uridyltransferase/glucosamine-1-phosphate-acetyltransferase GlmU-like protein